MCKQSLMFDRLWAQIPEKCFGFFDIIYERGFPYYFFWTNQWKADIKIFSWAKCEISKDSRDWHVLAGNDQRIISKNLNR